MARLWPKLDAHGEQALPCMSENTFYRILHFPFSPAMMDAMDGLLFSSMWCHPITVLPPARMSLRHAAATARQKWPGLLPEFSQKRHWPAPLFPPPARIPKCESAHATHTGLPRAWLACRRRTWLSCGRAPVVVPASVRAQEPVGKRLSKASPRFVCSKNHF